MGIFYRGSDGTERMVAGIAPAGQLIPSVSLYQKGSFEVETLPAGGYIDSGLISFQTPFPDTDYIITFDFAHSSLVAGAIQKTTSGFHVVIGNVDPNGGTNPSICYWKAFKLLTNEDRALDEEHIATNTRNFANEFSATSSYAVGDFVTYNNVLYRCTVAHTQLPWNSSHFTATNVGNEIKSEAVQSVTGITISQQPATLQGCWIARFGKVVQMRVSLSGASMTTASATTLKLTFPSSVPKPVMEVWSCNDHYTSEVDETAALRFTTGRDMYVFTTMEHSPLTNATVNIGVVYLTDE